MRLRNMGFVCFEIKTFMILCCFLQFINCSRTKFNSTTIASISVSDNETIIEMDKQMRALQRWRNAEKLVHKMTTSALRNYLVLITEHEGVRDVSQECLNSITYLIRGLASRKYWAYKMIDSSSRSPSGILSGTLVTFGDYDSCLSINVKDKFKGKYCNVKVSPMKFQYDEVTYLDISEIFQASGGIDDERLLQKLLYSIHPFYAYFVFRIAICMPSTCSGEDLEKFMNTASNYVGLGWESTVANCNVKTDIPFSIYEMSALILISSILIYVATGTILDIYYIYSFDGETNRKNSGRIIKYLLCFSLVTNTKRLLKEDNNPDSIKIFHGIKFFTILWVILNHTYNALKPEFMSSGFHVKDVMTSLPFQIVLNGYPTVETFFFISAVILMYARMKSKDEKLNVFMYIFRRAWRLGPAVAFITIGFFLFPRISDGPLWKENVLSQQKICIKYWWTNLLFINNWFPTQNHCLGWLWYVGADMQLYIFALVVLIPIKSRPKLGLWILGTCTCLSIAVIIWNQIYYKLPPTIVLTSFSTPSDVFSITERGYYRSHVHAITYCIGMATGYVIYSRPKLNVPIFINILGWFTAVVFGLAVVYGVHKWNAFVPATMTESVLYAVGSKIAWSLGLSWVTVMCATGNGGLISKFLSLRIFVPFSRMTYSTYILHLTIIVYYFYSTKSPIEARHRVVVFLYIAFIVTSFMAAFIYTQLFESPFMSMEKLMFSYRTDQPTTMQNNIINHALEYAEKGKNIPDVNKSNIHSKPDKEFYSSSL